MDNKRDVPKPHSSSVNRTTAGVENEPSSSSLTRQQDDVTKILEPQPVQTNPQAKSKPPSISEKQDGEIVKIEARVKSNLSSTTKQEGTNILEPEAQRTTTRYEESSQNQEHKLDAPRPRDRHEGILTSDDSLPLSSDTVSARNPKFPISRPTYWGDMPLKQDLPPHSLPRRRASDAKNPADRPIAWDDELTSNDSNLAVSSETTEKKIQNSKDIVVPSSLRETDCSVGA